MSCLLASGPVDLLSDYDLGSAGWTDCRETSCDCHWLFLLTESEFLVLRCNLRGCAQTSLDCHSQLGCQLPTGRGEDDPHVTLFFLRLDETCSLELCEIAALLLRTTAVAAYEWHARPVARVLRVSDEHI